MSIPESKFRIPVIVSDSAFRKEIMVTEMKKLMTVMITAILLCLACPTMAASAGDAPPVNQYATGLGLFPQVIDASGLGVALDTEQIETNIFNSVNQYRVNAGIPGLTRDSTLDYWAQKHSNHMNRKNRLHHDPLPSGVYGENVAYVMPGNVRFPCNGGIHTVPNTEAGIAWATMDMFMNHDACQNNGHKKNILRASFHYIGVGVKYGHNKYWVTQDFA